MIDNILTKTKNSIKFLKIQKACKSLSFVLQED